MLAVVVMIAVICLWFTAPHGASPFAGIALIFFGTGSFGLLCSGIGSVSAGWRQPTAPWWDLIFFTGIRRLVLLMLLCVVFFDGLGVFVMVMVLRVPDDSPNPGMGWVVVAFTSAALTVVCAGVLSTVVRRVVPRDLAQLMNGSSIFSV